MTTLRFCSFCLLFLFFIATAGGAEMGELLTLDKAVEQALTHHQAIQAAKARVTGTEGLRLQAGFRPNPELFLQTENWRFTGDPGFQIGQDLDAFAYVSQPLETGGKRALRVAAAQQDLKIAELEKQAIEWRIRQDVRQAFLRALLIQKQLAILRESGTFFQQVVDYHRVRVEQGATAEADLIKVQLEQERLGLAVESAQADAEKARLDLLRMMGVTDLQTNFQLAELPPLSGQGPPLDLKALLDLAHANRLEILIGDAQIERADSQVLSEKAHAKPDWNLLFGYKRSSGYDTILAGVTVPLTLFNRNQGNILHSGAEADRFRFLLRATVAQVGAEINSALVGIRRRAAMLREMEKGLVARAEQSWRISLAAYQEGGTDLLRLLDAQRVRNEVQLIFMRTQMDYRLSLAELENAVGQENLTLAEDLLRVQ